MNEEQRRGGERGCLQKMLQGLAWERQADFDGEGTQSKKTVKD